MRYSRIVALRRLVVTIHNVFRFEETKQNVNSFVKCFNLFAAARPSRSRPHSREQQQPMQHSENIVYFFLAFDELFENLAKMCMSVQGSSQS